MNSNLAIKRALDELEYAIIDLQLDFAARNLERALLELRYIPDQPRIPAGNPDGGQWTSYGGSAGSGRATAGRRAEGAFMAARSAWHRPWVGSNSRES
jgi:hypothetical protein